MSTSSLATLPAELYSDILAFVPPQDRQRTAYGLICALPTRPVPREHIFTYIRLAYPEQAWKLYLRLNKARHEAPSSAYRVRELSLETWSVDADVFVNLVKLLPDLESLSLCIGPNNFSPEHLEEILAPSARLSKLRYLSLRFRPYVQKASYFHFLKGAYFDSTLAALSQWPSSCSLPALSIIQDPLDSELASKQVRQSFAQPIVFFRLDIYLSVLLHSKILARSLHALRLRIPSRAVARPLCMTPPHVTTDEESSDLEHQLQNLTIVGDWKPRYMSRSPPLLTYLDLSTCGVLEGEVDMILMKYHTLEHLVLDGCPVLRGDLREGEWAAMGKRCALIGVRRAKEREKKVKAWLDAQAEETPMATAEPVVDTSLPRSRRGRRGLATATISIRERAPRPAAALANTAGTSTRIRILPSLPRLRSLSTTTSPLVRPEKHSAIRSSFETGWREGMALLSVTRARLRASAGSGVRILEFGEDKTGSEEGLDGLEDVGIVTETDSMGIPVLCLAGAENGTGHERGCGHEAATTLSSPMLPSDSSHTLQDQVHVAYAHDDIHTAKILLLKLKGIDVTDDDDPRIAAVQDEDFDVCFIPNGKLISEEEEKAMVEAQRREQIRRQREERLRACEYVWEHAKRRMREERLWLQRRRELEERRRTAEATERQRVLREREAVAHEERVVARAWIQRRNVVSYDTLNRPSSQSSCDDPFIYDVMPLPQSSPSCSPRRSPLSTPSTSPTRHHHTHIPAARPPLDDGCSVSFKEVSTSLNGPLFPITIEERRRRMSVAEASNSRSLTRDHCRQQQVELLDTLLSSVEWESMELRLSRSKYREVAITRACRRRSVDQLTVPSVSACTSSASSCPSLTRSSSWLSFGSRSSDTSSPATPPLIASWLKQLTCSSVHCRACQQPSRLVPVQLCDTPLHFTAEVAKVQPAPRKDEIRLNCPRRQSLADAAVVVAQGLGQLLVVAKQFQKAYMMAAVYNAAELNNPYTSQTKSTDYSYWHKKRSLIPAGMRVRSTDVKVFLASATPTTSSTSQSAQYIPLMSPFPPKHPPRTVLPNPLPYPIVFKPLPLVSRSPSRLQRPPGDRHSASNLRIRFVGNPAYLRLKALQNSLYERGLDWEGRGSDCRCSSGKEALPAIAVDGLGRSWLGVC